MYKTKCGKTIFEAVEMYIKNFKTEFELLKDEVDFIEFNIDCSSIYQYDIEQIIDNLNNKNYTEFKVVYDMLEECLKGFEVLIDDDDIAEINYSGNIDTIYFYN